MKIFSEIHNGYVEKIDADVFYALEKYLIDNNLASDRLDITIVEKRLGKPPVLSAVEFAQEVSYVVIMSGFSQKTGKVIYQKLMDCIEENDFIADYNLLFPMFKNRNKINAICKVWNDKEKYSSDYYILKTDEGKLEYLQTLPYIGATTKNHIGRNLGINVVKYDVWIQRLAIHLYGSETDLLQIKFPVDGGVKILCDKMFSSLNLATGKPIGYIDLILWKSCQIGLLKMS